MNPPLSNAWPDGIIWPRLGRRQATAAMAATSGNEATNTTEESSSSQPIYTATGPVLIAVNPFVALPHLYSTARQEAYMLKSENPTKPQPLADHQPHVYQMADDAFRAMMRALEQELVLLSSDRNGSDERHHDGKSKVSTADQIILVSGESGAGKTVTTKHIMQYLSALSQRTVEHSKTKSCQRAYQKVQKAQQPNKKNPSPLAKSTTTNSTNSTKPASSFTKTASTPATNNHNSNTAAATDNTTTITNLSIETQVLQSNPILEAFGNARTVRNDNSSRFGKCIDLQFTATGRLCGTNIATYLLEAVRVVHQTAGERNYHIFYQLLEAVGKSKTLSTAEDSLVSASEMAAWKLMGQPSGTQGTNGSSTTAAAYTPIDFKLLNGSGTFTRRDGVSDTSKFRQLIKAMTWMGFGADERQALMCTTAALLHASNLVFDTALTGSSSKSSSSTLQKDNNESSDRHDGCELDCKAVHCQAMCELLGLDVEAVNEALCFSTITVRGSTFRKNVSPATSVKGLDALIKATYGAIFTYLVRRINESIGKQAGAVAKSTIGVLDIFGFESFTVNSFEQLCINYCNEVLQQQFNTFMLKNEQATYASEGIDWDYISFPENQDVLDLLDDRKDGIISILDDMCRVPNATDKAFSMELVKRCKSNSRFRTNYKDSAPFFSIQHYAGSVEYCTEAFVEKNRDDLPRETTMLLLGSSNPFVHKLAKIIQAGQGESTFGGKKATGPTVGGHFLIQVKEIRRKIDRASPHYIRCIKPNALLAPGYFDKAMVASQLQCGGILQAVGVARNGFTLHYSHEEFVIRYLCLVPSVPTGKTTPESVQAMVDVLLKKIKTHETTGASKSPASLGTKKDDDELITIGKSRVLLKHHAFESLESMLGTVQNEKATQLNSMFRRFLCRVAYRDVRACFDHELTKMGQTFDEWFKENRELYYQPRKKQLGYDPIPNIVKLRQAQFKKATAPKPAVFDKKQKKAQINLAASAWMLQEGLWARNPDYDPDANPTSVAPKGSRPK